MPTAKGWTREFDEPIPLPDDGELRTLLDAGRYVDARPCGRRDADVRPDFHWDKPPVAAMGYR